MKRTLLKQGHMTTFCLSVIAGSAFINGCAATSGQLCAKPPVAAEELQLDKQVSKDMIDDHIYFSKEASSGGRSFGGGGCGCN